MRAQYSKQRGVYKERRVKHMAVFIWEVFQKLKEVGTKFTFFMGWYNGAVNLKHCYVRIIDA